MTYEEIIRGMVGDDKHYENWSEADLRGEWVDHVVDEDEFDEEGEE